MTDSSNCQSCKLLFRKVGFPMRSQNFFFFGISVFSLPVTIWISKSKLWILTFSIMSFFCSIFLHSYFCFFIEKTSILVSFSSTLSTIFFWNLHTTWKRLVFLAICANFPKCWAFFPFYFMFTPTIWTFKKIFFNI